MLPFSTANMHGIGTLSKSFGKSLAVQIFMPLVVAISSWVTARSDAAMPIYGMSSVCAVKVKHKKISK